MSGKQLKIAGLETQGSVQTFSYAVGKGAHDITMSNQASVDLVHEHQTKMYLFGVKMGDPNNITPVSRELKYAVLKNGAMGV